MLLLLLWISKVNCGFGIAPNDTDNGVVPCGEVVDAAADVVVVAIDVDVFGTMNAHNTSSPNVTIERIRDS